MAKANGSPKKPAKKASASKGAGSAPKPAAKKTATSAASTKFNNDIALLLQLAASAPTLTFPQRKSAAKLFELAVLAELLHEYLHVTGGTVDLVQPPDPARKDTFAGSPSGADVNKWSWFMLRTSSGDPVAEAWVSVQFQGLSASLAARHGPVDADASIHELDLTLLYPGHISPYPHHTDVLAAVSAKHVNAFARESVREALGFRREMGYFSRPHRSEVPWLMPTVPADPPSPLFLASSADNFSNYGEHIERLGIYTAFLRFPY